MIVWAAFAIACLVISIYFSLWGLYEGDMLTIGFGFMSLGPTLFFSLVTLCFFIGYSRHKKKMPSKPPAMRRVDSVQLAGRNDSDSSTISTPDQKPADEVRNEEYFKRRFKKLKQVKES